jgi:putative endopeptidase
MRFLQISAIVCASVCFAFAQPSPHPAPDPATRLPKLEHFDIDIVDPAVLPCDDFYKYACGKWLAAQLRFFRIPTTGPRL